MSIKPFIDLGWYTVPLKGELRRLESGEKTVPRFETTWREKYRLTRNEKITDIGGTLTGKISGIVAVDCDNANTWSLFQSLDPGNRHVFISKGKKEAAGTLIYQYTSTLAQNFSVHDTHLSLDFYSNNGFVYLPTPANTTKIPLVQPLPPIKPIPGNVEALLLCLQGSTISSQQKVRHNPYTASFLQPLVKLFVDSNGEYMPGLFRILTPRKYRFHLTYLQQAHLHPADIPDGEGSNYLSRVSAILGADSSIDKDLYSAAIVMINNLFNHPMEGNRLDKTIINPMINETAAIDGDVIWMYDEHWKKYREILTTKEQSAIELAYDDTLQLYYAVNVTENTFASFRRDSELVKYLQVIARYDKPAKTMSFDLPLVKTVSLPNKDFGFGQGNESNRRELNLFQSTPALDVFYHYNTYKNQYKKPETLLKFLARLVPNELMRTYLIRFLKTKLHSFSYSPVILYFLGVPGSGKGLFVRIIEKIFGLVPAPSMEEFLDKFNKWLVGTYFVELDEYGDAANVAKDKKAILGKLKMLTGKQKVDVREMYMNSYRYEHNVTFIMTSNKNPMILDEDDRRIALFETPDKLVEADWIVDIDKTYQKIMDEVVDFCYYLATEVTLLPMQDYLIPPVYEGKIELIAKSMPAAAMIAYCLKSGHLSYLAKELDDYGYTQAREALLSGRIVLSQLENFYSDLTHDKGTKRALIKILKEKSGATMYRCGDLNDDYLITNYA